MEHIELQGVSIVLLGAFSPAMFNPDWLLAHGVIDADEVSQAAIEVIHADMTQFTVGDLAFEVYADRFVLHVTAEPFVRSADVIAGIFREKLPHTPVSVLGINYLSHFRVHDYRQQNALGRMLAPIEPWGEWGQELCSESKDKNGGMVSLTMQQQNSSDRKSGGIRVTVQPSNRIEPLGNGVFVQVNDHYDKIEQNGEGAADLCSRMITPSIERSRRIVCSLSDYARTL